MMFVISGVSLSTHFGKNNISLEAIPLIAKFNPKVMVITGGGEPSLWRKDKKIYDLILEIRKFMGKIPLGIMSNGTFLMPNDAVEHLKWLRISVNLLTRISIKLFIKWICLIVY